jgi:FkbM family methyltransferase
MVPQINSGLGLPADQHRAVARSYAQLEQDLWVLSHTGHKSRGVFVEFGATDGVWLSNTYLLESRFDWSGVCAEPNPELFEKLKLNRRCKVSDACIGGQTGEQVEFVLADIYGGITRHAGSDRHASKRQACVDAGKVVRLKTVSLNDFLEHNHLPREIDYISVDTEGSELEILKAFPFAQWRVKLWTIEHNYLPQRAAIRSIMLRHGYSCTEMQWDDAYALTGDAAGT